MAATGVIYSLVSRGRETILSSFSPYGGNFSSVAMEVLQKCNLVKIYGQFATANYNFCTYVKDGFIFLVMVDSSYQTRIAVSFLKKIQSQFFKMYDQQRRNKAYAHSLFDFNKNLKQSMAQYCNKAKVDKLCQLQSRVTDLEQTSLRNMGLVLQRGRKIEVIVQKSKNLSEESYDIKRQAERIRRKMWWKNKKVMIGIVVGVIAVIGIVLLIALA